MKGKINLICLLLLVLFSAAVAVGSCGDDDDDDDDIEGDDDDATDDDDSGGDAVTVPADNPDGVDTGIDVAEGDTLAIEASGVVTLTPGGQESTPDGVAGETCNSAECPMADQLWGGLVALIVEPEKKDGKEGIVNCLFWVGSSFGQSAACGGRLRLVVNDFDYSDNSGSFSALITKGTASGKTWTDPTTGLEWEKTTHSTEHLMYAAAEEYCNTLTLDEKSGWRLPDIDELRTLIRGCDLTATGGECAVTDACNSADCFNENGEACVGCEASEGPASGCYWPSEIGGTCQFYWSTTIWGTNDEYAWGVGFSRGSVSVGFKTNEESTTTFVRCVR